VSSLFSKESTDRIRVGPILLGCLVGFLIGEILASVLVALGAQLAHFPGGYQAVSKVSVPPWWSIAMGLVGLWCGFLSSVYYATLHGKLAPLPNEFQLRAGDLFYVILGVACQYAIDLIYYPFHLKGFNKPVHHLFGNARGTTFVLVAVMTVVLAPIIEEWFFRGVLYRTLDDGLGRVLPRFGTAAAVVISACLFALAHGEPLQFVGLALFGVVLALVLRHTQRLAPSILTHMSFNAVAVVGLIVQRSGH
jgi:hypothetical protein